MDVFVNTALTLVSLLSVVLYFAIILSLALAPVCVGILWVAMLGDIIEKRKNPKSGRRTLYAGALFLALVFVVFLYVAIVSFMPEVFWTGPFVFEWV